MSRTLAVLIVVLCVVRIATALPSSAVNLSKKSGSQAESFIVINPTNPQNVVAFSNESGSNNTFRAYTTDGGATWTGGDILIGAACCDAQAVTYDSFGNLFVVYLSSSPIRVKVIYSTNGGATFSSPITLGSSGVDQPSIAAGNGSIWVDWDSGSGMVASGAAVTGLGSIGAFGTVQTIPNAAGSFGGIAVGPGANGAGKVIVTYQDNTGSEGPATIYVNVDPDGLGASNFGSRITVTSTNVGGFDYIPAQSSRSVDAEAGVAWDKSGGPHNGRIYLVYTDETVNENNDMNIYVRTSDDNGATWSSRVKVNDDATTRSQFLPYISVDQKTGTVAVTFHDARNDDGVAGTNAVANDDAEYFATYSTDGGATWAANTKLSCGFSNAADAGNSVDYGDYVGTDTYCGVIWAAWADNSNCTGDNPAGALGSFDLYARPLAFLAVDKAVTVSDGGATTAAGGTVAYTIHYSNSGRLTTGVVLSDTVPANTAFNAGASTAGWSCTPDGSAGSVCTLAVGKLVGCGGNGSATFAVTVDSPLPGGVTQISNTAAVSDDGANGSDANPADNTATDTTPIAAPSVDLTLAKTDGGATTVPGGTAAYTLNYGNQGNAAATGVVLTETVPANTTFNAGASTGGWSCAPDNSAGSTCTLAAGSVASGAGSAATFAVTVDSVLPGGVTQISNTASIADDGASGSDTNPSDNNASDTTPIFSSSCLFCDDFEDGILAAPGTWTYTKSAVTWAETGGTLIGSIASHKTTAVASPVFAGCLACYVEAAMQNAGGAFSRISLLGWYVDKKNYLELMMDADRGRWALKQRVNGTVVKKAKLATAINPNQVYTARITYNGSQYVVTVDSVQILALTPTSPTSGTVGFRVKATTGTFGYVEVN